MGPRGISYDMGYILRNGTGGTNEFINFDMGCTALVAEDQGIHFRTNCIISSRSHLCHVQQIRMADPPEDFGNKLVTFW